jgi:hypothetical protein
VTVRKGVNKSKYQIHNPLLLVMEPGHVPIFCNKMAENFNLSYTTTGSRDSSIGIVTGYRLDDRGVGIRVLSKRKYFSLLFMVQTDSEAQPASYPVGSVGPIPGDKAARVES